MSKAAEDRKREWLKEYDAPGSTNNAHQLGYMQGKLGHARLTYAEFVQGMQHPYPTSLWRAYRKGFTKGRIRRDELRLSNPESN